MNKSIARILFTLAVVGIAARSDASTLNTVPPGLSPGDTYRLVFVTSTTTYAGSSDISYYNTFVTDAADAVPELLDLGATWTAIGSTDTVSAVTNIGTTTSGIYTLDGIEVAQNTAALFNTPTTPLLSPIDIDPEGNTYAGEVWTGTEPYGAISYDGSSGLGTYTPIYGISPGAGYSWLNGGESCCGGLPIYSSELPMYAMSSEITVTPEPNTIGLAALGGAMLLLARRRIQRYSLKTVRKFYQTDDGQKSQSRKLSPDCRGRLEPTPAS